MKKIFVKFFFLLGIASFLVACGGGGTIPLPSGNYSPSNSVDLRLDWVEIENSAGDLIGPDEVVIQLFVVRANGDSRLLQAPGQGSYEIEGNGRVVLRNYSIGINNLVENEEVLVYLLVLDKDDLHLETKLGAGVAMEGGLRALEQGLKNGQLGKQLAGRASVVTFIISQVTDLVLEWWQQADPIGEYLFMLKSSDDSFEDTNGNISLHFSVSTNSFNSETVEVTRIVTAPAVSNSHGSANNGSSSSHSTTQTVKEQFLGSSAEGQDISVTHIGTGAKAVVLVGGMHAGFAPGSVALAEKAIAYFSQQELPSSVSLYVISKANPDSLAGDAGELSGRLNGNGVDINRNWGCNWSANAVWREESIRAGSSAFSEPETQVLKTFFEDVSPEVVIFFEAKGNFIVLGVCNGQTVSTDMAEIYKDGSGYNIDEITGYTLTGDVSDWLNRQGVPSFAILLSDYEATDWSQNRAGIQAILNSLNP